MWSKCENLDPPFTVLNTSYFAVALTHWQAATTLQAHWKTSHGFILGSPNVPLKTPPPHDVRNATDQAENWLQLLSLLLFSVSVLKTNIHFPFNENITPICIPSSCVITNADTSQIKIKQWSRCWPSVTPAAAAAAAAFHYTPTPPPPPPHKLTQAGYTPPSHSDKEQLCERQTMASDTDTTQR